MSDVRECMSHFDNIISPARLALLPIYKARAYSSLHTTGIIIQSEERLLEPTTTSGDYSLLGTDSLEYYHLDSDPKSPDMPYENPKKSGKQLRYGGRDYSPKDGLEAFSEMSKAEEGPDGTGSGGRQPEPGEP
ncbi:hypothetical protein BDZ97DRAFT_353174 [Flammula alnicola]|nr:hypothetical protein BDZ97DRAFT_353174 [Flammula alnicola]